MKKIIPISLLALFLFNCFGYRLLMSYFEDEANSKFEQQLDNNNYDESQLISIKVPVAYLPYYSGSKSFERVDGQIEIQGTPYKYVKRRIYNDSLELLCIPNESAMKWQVTKNEIFKFINDLQQDKKTGSHPRSVKAPAITDYISNSGPEIGCLFYSAIETSSPYSVNIPSPDSITEDHPPQIG